MPRIKSLIRKNILDLMPYSSARGEFSGTNGVFLDANENPFGDMNRYPDPFQKKLKQRISEIKSIGAENLFLGNGSDEIIDLCFRIFCDPGTDKTITFTPTYGMYEVSAAINGVELVKMPLTKEFQVDIRSFRDYIENNTVKLVFICSPNNPTANCIEAVEEIIQLFDGIVVVDEAYIDFSLRESLLQKLDKYPNLLVLQTLSKAWGLAAVRIGIAMANIEIINYLNKVKPPYNISLPNQEIALKALRDTGIYEERRKMIIDEKARVYTALSAIGTIRHIYPSETNFLLVEVNDAKALYDYLVSKNIIIRNRNSIITNCVRITIGSPQENTALLNAFKEFTS